MEHHYGVTTPIMSTPFWRMGDRHQFGAQGAVASANNIQVLREAKGWSRPELGKRMGTSGQQVERLEKAQRKLSLDWIDKAADALGVRPVDIISDDIAGLPPARVIPQVSLDDLASEHGLVFLEELDLALGMGATYLGDGQPEVIGIVPFREAWLRGMHKGSIDRLKVTRGSGDSMQPTILDGDIVIVDTAHRQIDDQDRLWAVAYGELGMIRRIRVTPRGSWLLMPDNQVVRPDEVGDGEVAVIGRVVWIGRRY